MDRTDFALRSACAHRPGTSGQYSKLEQFPTEILLAG
jgi:hypothetical protein